MADLSWVDPDGAVWPLSTATVKVGHGVTGDAAPPVGWSDDPRPAGPGSRLRTIRWAAREVAVPVHLTGDPRAELRAWAARFDPTRGDGKLRVGDRQLTVRYIGGLEQAPWSVPQIRSAIVLFRAFDPFWEDVTPDVRVSQVDAVAFLSASGSDPWFPWVTVDVDVAGGFTVVNDGDDQAWPVWQVQGPGGPITMTNLATGATIEVDTVLAAGEMLTVDTRPDVKTVTGPGNVNLWPDVSDTSTLWPIVPGSQTVQVGIADATAGQTQVRLEWRRRWLGP